MNVKNLEGRQCKLMKGDTKSNAYNKTKRFKTKDRPNNHNHDTETSNQLLKDDKYKSRIEI